MARQRYGLRRYATAKNGDDVDRSEQRRMCLARPSRDPNSAAKAQQRKEQRCEGAAEKRMTMLRQGREVTSIAKAKQRREGRSKGKATN